MTVEVKHIAIVHAPQYRTSQVYQNGAEGALVNHEGEQIGPWATCRDFWNDARRAEIWQMSDEIHGYEYTYGESPKIGNDRARLLLTNSEDPNLSSRLENIKAFLRAIETDLKVEPMTFYRIVDNPADNYKQCGVSFWVGSRDWIMAPPLFSTWTFLLRNGRNYEIGEDWRDTLKRLINGDGMLGCYNDGEYAEFALAALLFWEKTPMLSCFHKKIEDNYPEDMDSGDFHHYTGMCSYAYGDVSVQGWTYPDADLEERWWLHA